MTDSAQTKKSTRLKRLTLLLLASLMLCGCRMEADPAGDAESLTEETASQPILQETKPAETEISLETDEPELDTPEEEAFLATYYVDFSKTCSQA